MAYSSDQSNETDLDELIDPTEVSEKFTKAAEHLKSLLPRLNNTTLLRLYGLYKQATEGPCNTPQPGWFNTKGRAKWDAWNVLGGMCKTKAQNLYVETIEGLDPNFSTANKSKEGWVTVSTLHIEEKALEESDKLLLDYVKEGNSKQVREILESLQLKEALNILNQLDKEGMGLIHWAADRGFPEVLKTLILFGANVNLVDVSNQTALHYASSCGHIDCIRLLLDNQIDVGVIDSDGFDAKSVACDDQVKEIFNAVI